MYSFDAVVNENGIVESAVRFDNEWEGSIDEEGMIDLLIEMLKSKGFEDKHMAELLMEWSCDVYLDDPIDYIVLRYGFSEQDASWIMYELDKFENIRG